MTTPNPKESLELLPCPFCGGEAERIDIPTVGSDPELGGDPNAGGSCIQCKRCVASTALHFDRKENLYNSWNDRFMAGVIEQSGAGAPATSVRCGALYALATLTPPAGERREAIARIIRNELLSLNLGCGDEVNIHDAIAIMREDSDVHIASELISDVSDWAAGAILASGLVQDEAVIRADELEKLFGVVTDKLKDETSERYAKGWNNALISVCAAIRSARDGGGS